MKIQLCLICALFCFTGCSSDENGPEEPRQHDVYVAGKEIKENEDYFVAKYWKNGVEKNLTSGGIGNAAAQSMFIDGNDVYVCVDAPSVPTGIRPVTYWKNDNRVDLTTRNGEAKSIYISNNQVYVSGWESTIDGRQIAKYWKDGVAVELSPYRDIATANSIFVNGNDVYVAGRENTGTHIQIATYWKNGVPIRLSDSTVDEIANAIFISGNDVYVAGRGYRNGRYTAKYWKNGVPTELNDAGTSFPRANSIFVDGSNIHIAGTAGKATYWKNTTLIPYEATDPDSEANSVYVKDEEVYVAGKIVVNNGYSKAVYWKNGVPIILNTNPRSDAEASAIFVK